MRHDVSLLLRVFFGYWCLLTSARLPAQQLRLEWLTPKQGLSQGYVGALLEDREGFLWIGTKNGLNRYDGRHFDVFTNDPYDEHSLSGDHITALCEYGDFLLAGTFWSGLNLFHKKTRKCYRLHVELPDSRGLLEQAFLLWVAVDADGNIWAQLQSPGYDNYFRLYRFTVPPDLWKNLPRDPDWRSKIAIQSWPRDLYYGACMAPDGKTLYVASDREIFSVNTGSGVWTAVAPPLSPDKKADRTQIMSDSYGGFLFLRRYLINGRIESDLYRYRPDPGGQTTGQPAPLAINHDSRSIQHIAQGLIWLGFGQEVRGYRLRENGDFDLGRPPEVGGIAVPEGFSCSLTDRSGTVWIGTSGLGLIKLNLRANRFRHLFSGESIYSPVLQDRNGFIIAYNNVSKPLFGPGNAAGPVWPPGEFLRLSDGRMAWDARENCWAAGRNYPAETWILKKISPDGSVRVFQSPFTGPMPLALALDRQGRPWLGADARLARFDEASGQFTVFDFQDRLPPPRDVFSLAQTADGSWWLATRQGLIRIKPAAGDAWAAQHFDFEWFKNDSISRNSLRNDNVASLLTDPNDPNILWIGMKGGGLDRLDVRTRQFVHLTKRDGLPDEVIYGVLAESDPAEDGTVLWMSSNQGLIRYDPATRTIGNYTEEDGLQANEFNTWAYGKGPGGDLLFGGVNGLTVFHPRSIVKDTVVPRTFITGLRLNGRDVSWDDSTGILTQGIEFTKEITIPFSRNNVTLEFVALHFAAPGKNRFRYYLEGAEAEWSHETAEYSVSYLNLAPGAYVFRVKSANPEGVWNEQPAELKIIVLPPWYRTWLAWIAYVLLLGGGIYAFYRYQLRTRLEHAENERLKELDTFKSRFFTNVTHEFRTPLTVILGMTDRLEKNGRDEKERNAALPLIRRNGQNLLRLISEILDLAKLESNTLKMNYVQGNVLPYLRYISESLHSLANAKNVLVRMESPQAKIEMDYDPERLLQIVYNLLSNAVKFTPGGGKVTLRAEERDKQLYIEVADTGVGIPPEDLPRVFERFYQAKNQEHAKAGGTGIGLSLTRELVRAMGGEITAENVPGAGAAFTVRLPVTRNAPRAGADFGAGQTESNLVDEKIPLPNTPPAAGRSPNAEIPHLLIIEDNPDVIEYLRGCVEGQYQLDFAYNGRAGIEKAIETVPDIIISDVMMPEKDGLEVCDTLKNDERTSHIPIVLLTARATMEDRIAGLRRGADAYLAKPFNPEELLVKLNNLTQLRARLQTRYAGGFPPAPSEDKGLQIEDAFLQKIRAVVEANLSDSDFEMPQLERKMAMSRSQIFRKMKALTGKSPSQFIRTIRLEKARELLVSSELTVSEIAYETGFSSLQYFSDVFFEEFGRRPSATRN